ncbi:MAG: TonB-dependent receptor plug domain-containing protein, partial [Bacteroidota bacterium]
IYKQLYLKPSSVQLDVIDVSGRREQKRSSVEISKVTVTPKQIKSLPSAGGAPDIAQYLTVLPGIVSTGDQGGQLYIRGGSPVQNKILLDGMTIYSPFHSLGFFSVFETEIIQSVEVLSGGFNAEYGGRISAIVDLKTRAGNKKRFGGLLGINPFQANVIFEGPISKLKPGKGSTSFILTGKQSFIDQTAEQLYSNIPDSTGLPFEFQDFYGKISSFGANGSSFNAFGFKFRDGVAFQNVADYNWDSFGGGANFTLIPSNSGMIINGNINYSKYDTEIQEGDDNPRRSDIQGFNAGLNFSFFENNSEVKYGFEIHGFRTNFEFVNFVGNTIEQFNNSTEISGYGKYKTKFGKLIFEPSLRLQYYATLRDWSLEPRLGLKYN